MNSYKNVIRMSNFTEIDISENKEPGHFKKNNFAFEQLTFTLRFLNTGKSLN